MNELVIVDTNIVSYIFNGHSTLERYLRYLYGKRLAISFITLEESLYGAKMKNWGENRISQLCAHIEAFEIFHSTSQIAEYSAEIRAGRKHRPMPICDAWIAATALAMNCPLVTHNPKDFVDIPNLEIVTFHSTKPR